MDDEILTISPDRKAMDPYVLRLSDGHVRVTASSIVFPESCPRCGASPANTNVRLGSRNESDRTIKLPFCRRCGWILNLTQYLLTALMLGFYLLVFPKMKLPQVGWLAKFPYWAPFIVVSWLTGWAFEQIFKMFFKPGVKVVASSKEAVDLAFDDQMYAEKFVEINR